ncbi:MAG TPA: hypothetical protein PLY93_13215, partial [Turneriella sp.]|nr:hypothetical protein [Turneriella sp.]
MMMLLSERTLTGKLIFLTLALFSFFLPLHFFTSTVLLAAASLFFLISLCFREARLALHFAAAPRLRNLFFVLFLFALWRLFYGARTDGQSDVFASVRGVWFLLIPALIYFYASSRSRLYTLVTFFLAASAFAVLGNVWSTRAIFLEHPLQSFTATPATLYATAFVLLLGVVEASFFASHKVRGS